MLYHKNKIEIMYNGQYNPEKSRQFGIGDVRKNIIRNDVEPEDAYKQVSVAYKQESVDTQKLVTVWEHLDDLDKALREIYQNVEFFSQVALVT